MKSFISLLLFLILNQNTGIVDYIKFESLLGKHLSNAETIIDCNFRKNNYEKAKISIYSNEEYFSKEYFGMIYNVVTILTDEKDETVTSISIHFRKGH